VLSYICVQARRLADDVATFYFCTSAYTLGLSSRLLLTTCSCAVYCRVRALRSDESCCVQTSQHRSCRARCLWAHSQTRPWSSYASKTSAEQLIAGSAVTMPTTPVLVLWRSSQPAHCSLPCHAVVQHCMATWMDGSDVHTSWSTFTAVTHALADLHRTKCVQ